MKAVATTKENISPMVQAIMTSLLVVAIYTMISSGMAHAAVSDAVTNVLNQACGIVPSLGTLAIIVIGISAMFGRITWTQALIVAIGIAVASGAAGVFQDISGKAGAGNC